MQLLHSNTTYNTGQKMYYFERLSRENLSVLEKLYAAVYRQQRPLGYFMQKYDTAYTGVEYTGFIAYNEQHEPVAYYGVIPCFLNYNGKLILAAQSADTMTHPEHRHNGLFVQLAKQTLKVCHNEKVKLIFGFPNQSSLPGFMKLDWETTDIMELYLIPVETIPLENIAGHATILDKLYKEYQQQVLKKYLVPEQKGIDNTVLNDGFAGVNRDKKYLDNKDHHETQVIRIGKSLLWIKIKNAFVIGDISCADKDFDYTMDKVFKLASILGLKQVQFQTSPDTKASRLFSKRYHFIPSFNVMFKNLGTNINPNKIKFTFADVDSF